MSVSRQVSFRFNGRKLEGQPQDSLATALMRNGIRVFDRSIKRRRKRGISCLEGFCMSCQVEVDGEADVLVCQTPLREGMQVRSQIAWPSPSFDLRSPFQNLAFQLFGPELYYRLFTRPAWLNEFWIRLLGRLPGRARLMTRSSPPPSPFPFQTLQTQVLIVGGGLAGQAAAREVSESGLNTLLVDAGAGLGGAWSRWRAAGGAPLAFEPVEGEDAINPSPDNLQVLTGTTLIGLYEDQSALATGDNAAYRIHYQVVILAVGCYPKVIAFSNSDQPGFLPVQGLLRAYEETGWRPSSAVLLDIDGLGSIWAEMLAKIGIEVVVHRLPSDELCPTGIRALKAARRPGVKLEAGEVTHAEVVCWSAGTYPRLDLIRQAGGEAVFEPERAIFTPDLQAYGRVTHAVQTFAAGGCAGVLGFESAQRHGALVGAAAVEALKPSPGSARLQAQIEAWEIHLENERGDA